MFHLLLKIRFLLPCKLTEFETWVAQQEAPTPDEVERKRMAIFKHESQKDQALFPGATDAREFWQRAEDRNRDTARLYDKLGLPEYEAIEGFVRHTF
jgi:glucosamine-6-phosphate deaminase